MGQGQPLSVLLHGWLGSRQDWTGLLPFWPADWPLLIPDLPGHGESRWPVAPWQQTVDALAAALDDLATGPVHLAGYSLGGRLALALALHRPEQVASLALLGASPGLAVPGERLQRARWEADWAARLEQQPLARTLADWYAQPLFAGLRARPEFEQVLQRRLKLNPAGVAAAMRCWGASQMPNYWPELPRLQPPLLFLAGAEDLKYLQIGQEITRRLSRAQLQELPQAGHSLLLEAPEACARLLLQFWQSRY